jgi:hypothetical protein
MTNEPSNLHDDIGERIDLSEQRIAAAAREGGIPEFAPRLYAVLSEFLGTYVTERVYEEARGLRQTYEPVVKEYVSTHKLEPPGEVWKNLFPPRVGQPGHDTLFLLFDVLGSFWMELHTERRALRNLSAENRKKLGVILKWAPVFKKDYVGEDGREEMRPFNASARLFLAVAQLFDPAYTARKCNSVLDRAKNRRRNVGGMEKLKDRRRSAAERSRRNSNRSKNTRG